MNGQHTLAAIVKSQCAQDLLVVAQHCETIEELDILYNQYDKNRNRTLPQAYDAVAYGPKHSLSKTQTNVLGAAIPHILSGFSYASPGSFTDSPLGAFLRDTTNRMAAMSAWLEEAHLMLAVMEHCPQEVRTALSRAQVFGIALLTFRWKPDYAENFWHTVAREEDLLGERPSQKDPSAVLLRWLLGNPVVKIGYRSYPRYVASCWNTYCRKSHSMHHPYARDLDQPFRLAHTPHNGRACKTYLQTDSTLLYSPRVFLAWKGSETPR